MSRLCLAPGSGVLARRENELLFIVSADGDFLDAFMNSAPGSGLDTATRYAEDRNLAVPDFVTIDWSDGLRLAVFGGVEVSSDHRSLPRLSAAGAGTWVERSVRPTDGDIVLGVSAESVSDLTDLQAGVTEAGGFRLTTALEPNLSAPSGHSRLVAAAAPSVQPEQPLRSPAEPHEAGPPPAASHEDVSRHIAEPSELAVLADSVLGADGVDSSTERPPTTGIPVDPMAAKPDDVTIVPDASMEREIDGLVGRAASSAERVQPLDRRVPGRLCTTCGAANPSDVFACGRCGAPLPAGEDSIEMVPAPQWQLVFDDGSVESVSEVLRMGRAPDASDDTPNIRTLSLECKKASANHLEVRVEGWKVYLTDLGSKNGSFMLTSGDDTPVQLDAHTPQEARSGTAVLVGSRRFRVEQLGDGR